MQFLLTNAYFFSKIIIGTFSVEPNWYWEHFFGETIYKKKEKK